MLIAVCRFWTELGQVFDKISQEPTVLAVVLGSTLPKFFSAGIDCKPTLAFSCPGSAVGTNTNVNSHPVSALSLPNNGSDPARSAFQLQKHILGFQDCISAIERCPYPVVVAAHGYALGLSVDIISACDVRYAAANTIFAIKVRTFSLSLLAGSANLTRTLQEVDVGLAADIGSLARVPKVAGNQSLVHELAYTGRNFSAAEAEKLGFISRVVEGGRDEVTAAALEVAKLIAEKSPVAVAGTKHLLLHSRDHTYVFQ